MAVAVLVLVVIHVMLGCPENVSNHSFKDMDEWMPFSPALKLESYVTDDKCNGFFINFVGLLGPT